MNVEKVLALLKELEWSGHGSYYDDVNQQTACPLCFHDWPEHGTYLGQPCQLAQMIYELQQELGTEPSLGLS